AAKENINAGTDVIEAELEVVEASIKVLMDEYNKGALDITNAIKDKEIMTLEKRARDLRAKLVVRRCQTLQLAGEMTDKMALEDAEAAVFNKDWSYVDMLVSRYRTPTNATLDIFRPRDPKAQDRFRASVIKAYSANNKNGSSVFCCITGGFIQAKDVVAAHIVPYNIGENNAVYLFGETTHKDGHTMCPQNGLPMMRHWENAFDNGEITIIPGETPGEWKVALLDPAIDDVILQQVHGKVLTFPNDFRPAKQYLYFAHVVTILRRQRFECTGWWRYVPPGIQDVWATPGEYLRKSALVVLARRAGHMAYQEATELLGVSSDDGDDE
ncbi:hypothetical protein B0T25DRAFT_418189, partial [Lasiosphaeria hispida]